MSYIYLYSYCQIALTKNCMLIVYEVLFKLREIIFGLKMKLYVFILTL